MIFQTAYDTTAMVGHNLSKIADELKQNLVLGNLSEVNLNMGEQNEAVRIRTVRGGNASDTIPSFMHPLLFSAGKGYETTSEIEQTMFLDIRSYGAFNPHQNSFTIRNKPEYVWAHLRACMNAYWLSEQRDYLRDLSILPITVYASIISQSVARRYALDPGVQAIINVLASFYYICLFKDDKQFDELEYVKAATVIAKATRVPIDTVYKLTEGQPAIDTIDDFCNLCYEKTQNIRLKDFNVGMLITITGFSWMGTNARELMAVSLEHPPTWLMIIYAACSEASFKKSLISKQVDLFAKKNMKQEFVMSVNSIFGGAAALTQTINHLLGINLQGAVA